MLVGARSALWASVGKLCAAHRSKVPFRDFPGAVHGLSTRSGRRPDVHRERRVRAVLTLRYSFQEMIAPGERPRWWRLHRSPAGRGAAPARRWACPKYQQVIRAPNFVTGFGKEKGGFQRGKPPFANFQGRVALLRCLQQSKRTGMIRLPVGGSSLRQGRSQGWLLAPALRPHS